MSRLYGGIERIDTGKVRDFFDQRADAEKSPLHAVMLQGSNSQLPVQKDEYERAHLLPAWPKPAKVFEAGCGAGRLAAHYLATSHCYMGIDFSSAMIDVARKAYADKANAHFAVAAVPNIDPATLPLPPPYDVMLVSALFLYMNDEEAAATLKMLGAFAAPQAVIYIRESLSELDKRLTLRDFFSEELKSDYNAIYRTVPEFTGLCEEALKPFGFTLEKTGYAFPPDMRQRSETAQYYYLFRRQMG